jgi:tripartite-type tricarboxylate transporter receptor subunit TctC
MKHMRGPAQAGASEGHASTIAVQRGVKENAMCQIARSVQILAVAILGLSLSGSPGWPQTTRTIKIVVPVPPGGGMDFLARLLAEQIGRTQGLTIIVESRPGAGGRIATEAVARLAPDGTTLLMTYPALVVDPHVRKVNYHPLTSFEPICNLVDSPNVIAVNSASPYRTLAELMSAARSKPGDVTMASIGPASNQHIAIETAKRTTGIGLTYVPYAGSAPAVNALLGEHVTSLLAAYANVAEQIAAGKLRALAAAAQKRIAALPDVPAVAEAGYKDFELDNWFGVVAPAKTPKEMISQFAGWFTAAMQLPEVKAKLAVQGLYPVGMCGADFNSLLRKQSDDYGRIIREANIKPE